jgi:VIT1/CCC1 family predicted Fe2+/Mn2+ transporter
MQAFAQAMAAAQGEDAVSFHMPNLADITAARQGDRAAIARLQAQSQQESAKRQAKHGQTGLQTQSFLSFHPPLKKRMKRLERMGAHFSAAAHARMSTGVRIFTGVVFAIIVPLLALAAGLMLVAIAMIIGLNLVFLGIWLAVIHVIFVWLNGR